MLHIAAATAMLSAPALAQNSMDDPVSNQVKPAQGTSPDAQPNMFQPLSAFPANEITSCPHAGSQNGGRAPKETVRALQRTLTELQQLELQPKDANAIVRGSSFDGLFHLPQVGDRAWRRPITQWRGLAADLLLALAGFHAAAAIVHHHGLRDGLIARLVPAAAAGHPGGGR